jgi:hemerythrin
MGKWVMYCVPCGVEQSINPSFNLLNWKTHLSLKASEFDSVHEKNLKLYQNKKINAVKEAREDQEKVEATMKQREDRVFKYAAKGK